MATLPKYIHVEKNVKPLSPLTPAEIHGIMCGYLCAHVDDFEKIYSGFALNLNPPPAKMIAVLQELFVYSRDKIFSLQFDFQLLLPSDRVKLKTRAIALSLFCEGFLIGLNNAVKSKKIFLNEENREIMQHVIKISELEHEELEVVEEDEASYTEIVEYIRMVVLNFFSELDIDQKRDSLH